MLRVMSVNLSSQFLWKGGKTSKLEMLLARAQLCHECLSLGSEARPSREMHFWVLFGCIN